VVCIADERCDLVRRSVAALYDIHGNLPALDAALDAIEALDSSVETIVIGGDVVLGPMPRATLERVMALGDRARYLRGNCDRLVVDAFDRRSAAWLPAAVQHTISWVAAQLDQPHRDFLAAFPETLTLAVHGIGDVLFCHGSPRSDDEMVTSATPDAALQQMLAGVRERVVVCGHTHMQFDRTLDGVRVINAGSVGMPYGAPGAHWLLLGPDISSRRTPYDLERAAALVRLTAYPGADEFAARYILAAPGEAEMLRALGGATSRPATDNE
jgi:putative phosphoesterase